MIIIICKSAPPEHTGAGKRMYSFFRYLKNEGYEVKFVTNTPLDEKDVIVIKKCTIENYLWKFSPLFVFLFSLAQFVYWYIKGNFKSTDGVRTVWLVSSHPLESAASVFFYYAGYRIITQNVLMHSDDPSRRPGGRLNIFHKLRTLQYRFSHAVTSNSPGLYKLSKPHHPNCIMIPNPVEIQKVKNTVKPGKKTDILFVGRVSFRKGADIVFKAIDLIHIKDPEIKFTLVGPYDDMDEELKNIYSSCENINRSNVLFAGYQEDTQPWYRKADIFFLPSRREGLGTVFLEAISYGIPVVANKLYGVTDYIFDNGYPGLIDSEDPEIYAGKLLKMINHPHYYEMLVAEWQPKLRRFETENIFKKYVNLITGQ